MSERVLVTGASGFLGRHVVSALQNRGYDVITHSSRDGDIATFPFDYEGVSHVFHLAARAFVPDSWANPQDFYRTNVLGTVNMLESCRKTGASATLMSSYVYGQPQRLPIDESHPVQAFNPYSHSKILAEQVADYYHRQFGVTVSVVRAFNIYGPGQSVRYLIPLILKQALDPARDAIAVGDLRPKRDYLHVRDLVELLLCLMQCRSGAVYNAGTGESFSVAQIVETIAALGVPAKPLESEGTPRPEEVLDVVADISKAQRELGWRPAIKLKDGMAELIALARSV